MLSNSIFKKASATLLLAIFLSSAFSIANAEKGRKGPPNHKPPKAAFIACSDQAEGGTCSFSTPDGDTIQGMCKVSRKANESLVCKPSRNKKKGRGGKKRD